MGEVNAQAIRDLSNKGDKFVSLALVNSTIVDKDEVLVKVTLQPTGETPLVRMSWDYVGNGWGMYVLPRIDDEVLCVFPNGDINRGILIKRLNNGVDKLPEGGVTQDEILLVTMPGQKVNININGDLNAIVKGNVNIEANAINIKTGG